MAKKEFAKNKKKKVPFAVLRKGALCALLCAGALAGGLLVGCDEAGTVAGPIGVNFHYGVESPDEINKEGKVGDYYYESDVGDVWVLTAEGWEKISNLKGPAGSKGNKGDPGEVVSVEIIDGYWVIDGEPTGVKAESVDGVNGKSAFELAIADGFDGTVGEWLESLKGEEGKQGYYVTAISEVVDDKWGISSHFEFTLNDEATTVVSTQTVSRLMPNYYYGATTGAEILELIELGAENIQIENDIELTDALAIEHNLSVDLNNHKLTYSNIAQVVIDEGIEVEFKDGEMDFAAKSSTASSLKVQGGASLILDNVDYISSGTNVMVIENATSVKVVDSHLTGAVYCVGTNALTSENFGVKIEIDDCEFDTTGYEYLGDMWFDTTPILINIPCTATIKDSKITGHRQAVIVRGGDVVIENCKLISTGKDYISGLGLTYNTDDAAWGQGNEVPFATLVAGNDGKGIYANYATKLDLVDVEIISQKISLGIPTIWIGGGNADENGLTVNYSAKQMDESFMYGLMGNGANFVINVEVNDYETLVGVAMMAMETQGLFMPKLTHDILAYDTEITVEDYLEVQMVRETLTEMGILGEFDIWTMFNPQDVYVSSLEGFEYAVEELGLNYFNITLINNIYLEQYGPISLEDCIKYSKINEQLNLNGYRFEFSLDTQNLQINNAELLQDVVNLFGDRTISVRLTDDIEFTGLGLVIGQGQYVTIDLNGHKVSAPNDKVGDGVFHVLTGGRLIIEDYTGLGVVDGECICEDGYKMAVWADGGEVIINGGTFTNSSTEGTDTQYDLIYASNGGMITINGGRFDCKTPRWTLNIKNAHKDYTFITVNGGEFKNYDPSASTTDENKNNNPPTDFTYGREVNDIKDGNDTWYVVVSNMGDGMGNPEMDPEY